MSQEMKTIHAPTRQELWQKVHAIPGVKPYPGTEKGTPNTPWSVDVQLPPQAA